MWRGPLWHEVLQAVKTPVNLHPLLPEKSSRIRGYSLDYNCPVWVLRRVTFARRNCLRLVDLAFSHSLSRAQGSCTALALVPKTHTFGSGPDILCSTAVARKCKSRTVFFPFVLSHSPTTFSLSFSPPLCLSYPTLCLSKNPLPSTLGGEVSSHFPLGGVSCFSFSNFNLGGKS